MKRTIRWPLVISSGRATMTPDPMARDLTDDGRTEALHQLISVALHDQSSTHPWDYRFGGSRTDRTFKPTGQRDAADAIADVRELFAELEADKRAKLLDVRVTGAGAERRIAIEYLNLEHGTRRGLEVPSNA